MDMPVLSERAIRRPSARYRFAVLAILLILSLRAREMTVQGKMYVSSCLIVRLLDGRLLTFPSRDGPKEAKLD